MSGSAIHACTAATQAPRAERPDCSPTAGVQRHADAIAHRDQQIAPSAESVTSRLQRRQFGKRSLCARAEATTCCDLVEPANVPAAIAILPPDGLGRTKDSGRADRRL